MGVRRATRPSSEVVGDVALSANERETAGRMEFSVEGENEGSRDDAS